MAFIFVIPLIFLIYYLFNSWRSVRPKNNVLFAFTGQMGSGKSYHAVKFAIKQYKKRKFMKKIGLIKSNDPIVLYSNIPVLIQKERKLFGITLIKEEWASVLEREHLLMEKRMTEHCVILIDEISTFASQWDYDNPNCQVQFAHWLRFCRHYLDPIIYVTAQSSDEILVDARRKLATCYNLDNHRRTWLFFYKVDVTEVKFTEEIKNINEIDDIENKPFLFGILPFKYVKFLNRIFFPFSFAHYDSRCYSDNYPALNKDDFTYSWNQYKTDYFIDLTPTIDQVKEYKESKKGIRQEYVKKYIPNKQVRGNRETEQ